MTVKVSGGDEINRAMTKFIKAEQSKVRQGMQKAGLFVKGEAVQLAPVEFGVLRNSAFYGTDIFSSFARLRIGFTAKYAPWVHEMPMKLKGQPRVGRKGVYWQGGENKFLQKAINRNTKKILSIIQKEAKF